MSLRNLLAATAASALVVGTVGIPAYAATPPSPANAGTIVTWGNESDVMGGAAIPVPSDLTEPVRSAAANTVATGVVTLSGGVRVWGRADAPEVSEAPTGIADASTIVMGTDSAAVLHTDGHVTAWGGSAAISQVPTDLRAKAIALGAGTGYAVRTDGTLAMWGDASPFPTPDGGWTDLVDVSASLSHVLALHADGTVSAWSDGWWPVVSEIPDFGGHKIVDIAAGFGYSGVVREDGQIQVWGVPTRVPSGQPDFDGQTPAGKVVSLSVDADANPYTAAAAVTADGAVHVWGSNPLGSVPESLTGRPVSAVALSANHAVAVVTTLRDLTKPTISGTAKVGQTLSSTPATFSLTPDSPAGGQWYAGNTPIAGQTAATLTLDAATAGKLISYRMTATRGGDTVTSTSAPLGPVAPVASTLALRVDPASAAAGTVRTATATVTSVAGSRTGTVTFTVGSTRATVKVSGGKATWTLPTLAVGRRSVTAAYSGDAATTASTSAAALVTVTKASSKVSGRASASGKTAKTAKKLTLALTVTSTKGVSPAGKVKVTVTGPTKKTVTVSVNSAGKATMTWANVKRGTYSAKLAYAGNTNVSSSNGSVKFKV